MKKSLDISLIKTEGLSDQSENIGCYITIDDRLHEVVTPLRAEICENSTIEIPSHGLIRFIIKAVGQEKTEGSVSMEISILPLEGTLWLPLYENISQDYITMIPSQTQNPRLLISINQFTFLTPVPDVTECDQSSFLDHSFSRFSNKISQDTSAKFLIENNKNLRAKIIELENKLQEEKMNKNQENNEELLIGSIKVQISQMQEVKNDIEKQARSFETLYKQEKYQREHLEKQVNNLTQEFEIYVDNVAKKEKNFVNEIFNKEKEIMAINEKNLELSMKIQHYEQEIEKNNEKQEISAWKESEIQLKELQDRLHQVLEVFDESEFQRKLLQEKLEKSSSQIEEISKNYSEKLISLSKIQENEISRLNSDLSNCHKKIAEAENLLEEKEIEIISPKKSAEAFKLKELYFKLENAEKENIDLKSKLKQSYDEISQQNEQIKLLTERLALAKRKSYEQSQQIKSKITPKDSKSRLLSENADERFIEYLKNYGVENQFQKITEGTYAFGGTKKVHIAIKNGSLVCKVGGGFMMIDQFLRLFITQERRNEEEDPHKLLGALISPRERPTISPNKYMHKRSNTFSMYNNESPKRFGAENEENELTGIETDRSEMKTERSSGSQPFKENYNLNTPSPVRLKIPRTTEKQITKSIVPVNKEKAFTPLSKSVQSKKLLR